MGWLVGLVLGFVAELLVVVVVEFAVYWFFAVWVGFWVGSVMMVRFVLVRLIELMCPWLRLVLERCFVDLVLPMS